MTRRRQKRKKTRSLYLWHKYIGLTAALFVFLLSFTGIALNHTSDLRLDRNYISSEWLLEHYNVTEPARFARYPLESSHVSQVDDLLILGEHTIGPIERPLIGAVDFYGLTIVALKGKLLLIDDTFNVIETLGREEGVPILIQSIGKNQAGQLVFKTPNKILQIDEDFIEWSEIQNSNAIDWSQEQLTTKSQQQQLTKLYRSHIIHIETFVLDLHSGRVFGRYGELFFDLIAILLIFLAGTGIWIWLRQKRTHIKK